MNSEVETTIQLNDPSKGYGFNKTSGYHPDYRKKESRWKTLFDAYWEKSSISGIPFITSTKFTIVRIIWTILLIIACIAMTCHLVYLFAQYFSYNKQSEIDLEFKNLKLPAVTICNVNILRRSKLTDTSPKLQNIVTNFNATALLQAAKGYKAEYERTDLPRTGLSPQSLSMQGDKDEVEVFRSGNFLDDFDVSALFKSESTDEPPGSTNFTDSYSGQIPEDMTTVVTDDYRFKEEFPESWEAGSQPSSSDLIQDYMRKLFADENRSGLSKLGHRIQDMLRQCSFNGRRCSQKDFYKDVTGDYGNCYTLQNSKFDVKRSGPKSGLEMVFFLETDEYIQGFTTSQGLQVVVHEPDTLPFPDDDGIAVDSGTNTFIGLKKTEIKRLGSPHGRCTPIDKFQDTYGVIYTRQICQKICFLEQVWTRCHCYDSSTLMLNNLVRIPWDVHTCKTTSENACVRRVKHNFEEKSKTCKCDNPCSESQYRKIISSRKWPEPTFAKILVAEICNEGSQNRCDNLQKKSDEEIRNEFVKLNIFYEDLNYEKLEENPDYEFSQFMSDIGGTIGLWIGLSLLSLFEIFHLVIHVVITYFYPEWKNSFSERYKYRTSAS